MSFSRRPHNATRRALVGGRRAFSPAHVPGGVLWLDFSDVGSLTLAGSEITDAANKFGTGLASDAAAVSTGPTLTMTADPSGASWTGRNGRSYAVFTNNPMAGTVAAGAMNAGWDCTVFVAADNVTGSAAYLDLHGTVATTNDGLVVLKVGENLQPRAIDAGGQKNGSKGIPHTDWRVLRSTVESGVGVTAAVDGVADTPTAMTATVDNIRYYDVGRNGSAVLNLAGGIGEIIVYNRLLSAVEIAKVEAYLAAKWGTDWRALDWSQYGSVEAAYSAHDPANTGSTNGTIVTAIADQVGSDNMSPVTGGVANTVFTGPNDPGMSVSVGTDTLRAPLSGVGSANGAFCSSFVVRPTLGSYASGLYLWCLAASSQAFTYFVLERLTSSGYAQIVRRTAGSGVGIDIFPTTIELTDGAWHVVTLSYDGTTTYLRIDDEAEVSQVQPESFGTSLDRLSIGALDRATPIQTGNVDFRELVLFDEFPDASVRAQIHSRMQARLL